MNITESNSYYYIATSDVFQVVTGACTLKGILIGTKAAGTIRVIDGTSGQLTPNVAELVSNAAEGWYPINARLGSGLRIATTAAVKATVIYTV